MKDRVRVAYTIEQCWHRVPGGTAVAGLGMARALMPRGDVELVGVAGWHRSPPPEPWRPPMAVRHLPFPRVLLYELWHYLRRPAVQLATGPVDVIHATAYAIPPKTAPTVMTAHDFGFLHDPSHYTRHGVRFFKRGLDLALQNVDVVLCPSQATQRDCEAAGFARDKLRIVPFGVDARPVTKAEVEEARRRYGLKKPYVLWVGTIEPRKNLAGLMGAFAAVDRDLDLVLAGPAGWNEDLSALVARYGVEVRALGFVARDDLAALYAGAEVFCFPSHLEGFGFPVLEAMAQGTPVVTSAGTSTEELGGDAVVLVDSRDPQSIAAGLDRVLDDRELAARLGEAGRARAAQFTWERTGRLVAETYTELAA